jgi:NAD(P)H-hydrate epimerase
MLEKYNLPRLSDTHKGDYGKVLIIAGSSENSGKSMLGAAALCGKAALKAGAGLVTISSSPRDNYRWFYGVEDVPVKYLATSPELMYQRLNYKLFSDLNSFDAIAIGPGIGQGCKAKKTVRKILRDYRGRLVIDADALNIISKSENLKSMTFNREKDTILTPHVGEAKRIFGEGYENEAKKISNANLVVLIKGSETKVFSDEEKIIKAGNPGMATAGSGDVLTGIIAALLAQKSPVKFSAKEAAETGVIVHGEAGDRAKEKYSERSLTASNIVDSL